MAKKINVDTLKISNEAKERLTLSGIDFIEELNTFNLTELERLLGDFFDEILPYLRKFGIPSQLSELKLSDETIKLLNKVKIHTLSELFNFDKYNLFDILKDDVIVLQEINSLFNTYQLTLLEAAQFGEMTPKIGEINLDERIRKEITPIRKGYGSRAYSHFKIRIASPNEILQWSYGEVLNHETINYRTSKPENGGLFCERIFGPTRDYQCHCGKKQSGNKGQICQKCGVEITESKVRRERMGHIKLQAPIVHTWYLKNSPSRLAILLGIKAKSLEEIVYHASYIVTEPGRAPVRKKDLLTEIQYSELQDTYGRGFIALTGAEAVKKLLQEINLEEEITALRKKIHNSSKQKREAIIKRLEVLEAFASSDNKPEWMVMDVIPVLPPDLRPMVQLDGGRFATTDLNDLYRRILNRNARLQKQIDQMAPRLIVKNEKRMLQEAVDALFDNAKRGRKAAVERNRSLKSLSDLLRGKQGRFRQNLLGKRVDYSGRSVIVVGPDLEMHQAGIPRDMALTLFKPFVLRELQKDPEVEKRNANQIYERREDRVWAALDVVIKEHPILLNRAPTLHRLGIQAFEPKLIDGKAIRIHPLVTPAFNADFDGDQMAVHVPLSPEAIAESRLLMLSSNNILNPKDGKPVVTPSQDMVLGNYYLTIEEQRDRFFYTDVKRTIVDEKKVTKHRHKHRNEGMFFSGAIEAKLAYENKIIDLHTRIFLKPNSLKQTFTKEQQEKYLVTTVGKIIFNEILPESFPYINEPTVYNLEEQTPDYYFMDRGVVPTQFLKELVETLPFKKRFLSQIIARIFKLFHITETSKMLDKLKDLGFEYSTIAGFTISYDDINVYSNKEALVAETNTRVEEIKEQYEMGLITNEERRKLIINEWQEVRNDIQDGLMKELDKDNNLYMMSDSGARGSVQNFSQLAGMRGLMNNPKGDIIEVPVQASFIEGLSVSEFFISTHGARKGSTDTALKTAESGYLTRRLVDVSQDVIVVEDDCKTERGILVDPILENDKVIVPLKDRIIGRYTSSPVFDLKTGEVIIDGNMLISEETASEIIANGHEEIHIRSILTCDTNHGVCTKCYGINLATNSHVEVGEAVGVVAAQSIGEPGTQLTMRTFHTGGVASVGDITQGLPRIQELFEARNPKGKAIISESSGVVKAISRRQGVYTITIHDQKEQEYKYPLDPNVEPIVDKGDAVFAGQRMSPGSINPKDLLRVAGVEATQRYILEEVQKVYRSQSVEISDKHIEVIVRQMLQRIDVKIEGDTNLLPGTEVSVTKFKQANAQAIKERKRLAVGQPILLGITRASLRSDSFLSAASFQETTRILTDAVINGKVDELHGLKENVIIGGLIPAGTGILQDSFFDYNPSFTNEKSVEEE